MLIAHLIKTDQDLVYSDQTPVQALEWSATNDEPRVPVVDRKNRVLVGTIREDVLLDRVNEDLLPLYALENSLIAYPDQHAFDVWHSMVATGSHVIPVTSRSGSFLGFLPHGDLTQSVEQLLGLTQEGITLLVESDLPTLDLQHLIGIIEKEGVRISSLAVDYDASVEVEEAALHRVTVRLQPANADRAVSSLRRYGYAVHTSARSHNDAEWADRVNELIRYLEL